MANPITELKARVATYQTQNEAARALGVSSGYLSDLMNGKRGFGNKMLKALGIRVRYEFIERSRREAYNSATGKVVRQ